MSLPPKCEPEPVWPNAPRLAPDRAFPPYRFVPGLNPHPTGHPRGHSRGAHLTPLPLHPWRDCIDYLWGIDLYHNGYFWEAHEAWENLWQRTREGSTDRYLLQALIFNSAAQLKAHLGSDRGARIHSKRAMDRIATVKASGILTEEQRLGLDLDALANRIELHYGELWKGALDVKGPAPRLQVTELTA
ncbi:MAG: hypothetical protein AMXMBFR84_11250 [Candidatus Hydrogenedentota bacterium]